MGAVSKCSKLARFVGQSGLRRKKYSRVEIIFKRRYVGRASPLHRRPGSGRSAGRRAWMCERLAVEGGSSGRSCVHRDCAGRRGAGTGAGPSGKRFARWRRRRERYDGAGREACLTRVATVYCAGRAAYGTRIADRNFESEAAGRRTAAATTRFGNRGE